jgi:hypothetical protein
MKIRTGFVSNSSSSSFLIYGAELGYRPSEEKLKTVLNKLLDGKPLLGWKDRVIDVDELGGYELCDHIAGKLGLSSHGNSDYGFYIGASWDTIKDDETGAQFKARVETALKKAFGDDESILLGTHEALWYDG